MEEKRCSRCGVDKPRTDFYPQPDLPSGVTSECKACLRQRVQRDRALHGNEINQRRRQRHAADPERKRAANRASYRRHVNKRRAATRAAYQKRPGDWVASWHRRRGRWAGTGGSWTWDEWQALCAQYGNRCLCCGSRGPLTVDHVIPLQRGGSNDIANLQPLCGACNDRKGTRPTDYRPLYGQFTQLELSLSED